MKENNELNEYTDQVDMGITEYLQGYIPVQFPPEDLPSQMPNSAGDCNVYTFYLSQATFLGLNQFTKDLSIELGIAFVAAIRILHYRYSGISQAALSLHLTHPASTADVAVSHSNDKIAVCLLVNGEDTVSTIWKRAREAVGIGSQYSEAAIIDAAVKLGWNRINELNPVIPILVALNDSTRLEIYNSVPGRRTPFEMEWHFHTHGDTFRCNLIYDRALFKMETIQAFSENFIDVVDSMLHEPDLAVEEVSFSHALNQLRQAGVPMDPPSHGSRGTLSESFTAVAAEHGEKLALIDGELRLTYCELDILSSVLAKQISDATKAHEKYELISFCIPPSALAILAILGITKYGAAYVPLDVRFPNERLETLLSDSGARLLITTRDSPVFATKQSQIIRLDISDLLSDWKSLITTGENVVPPLHHRHTDLAYIMYTSGSTGRPKGVAMAESSVLSFVSNRETFPFGPGHVVAQISNLAWDASIIDVWCTLLSGATLVCFNRYDALDPPVLAQLFKAFKINCCFMSPALFRQILSIAPDLFGALQTLILGGEPVFYESLQKLKEINSSVTIQNVYGPTETCVVATTFSQYPQDDIPDSGPMPIGRPLKTAQVLVVDKKGRLVPPGVIGELVIGGKGVARGYLNRPVETSQAFVEMAFEGLNHSCSTYYRSGDAVKWRSDGHLQFVNRMSIGQVKIRGQRLELAEVEATIVRTGLVKGAAVTYFKPKDGRDAFLVAYVVTDVKLQTPIQDNAGNKNQPETDSKSSKLVETWRELYDDMYSEYDITEARAKFLGWDSMVTGLPIPQDEMIAWLHDTLRPFFQQRPRTVFEVGCGIGIFLYEMAPFVDHLWAIEPSGEAVQKLKAQLRTNNMADKFSLWHGAADHIPELPLFQSEFVLINSVVQYLPSEAYLHEALVNIIDRCAQGSRILLGDIRSLPFDDLLGIDIILHEWKDELEAHTIRDLRDRIVTRNRNRTELLLDPTFFFDLQRSVPAISHVEIVPKVMEKSNELSQFRYQVILHILDELAPIIPERWYDYEKLGWNSASFEDKLRTFVAGEETVLAVEGVPNKFLSWENAVASIVFSPSSNAESSLSNLPSRQPTTDLGWSAWDLERLAERFGVDVQLSFARQSQSTGLDAVFSKKQASKLPRVVFKLSETRDFVLPSFSSRSLAVLDPKYSTRPEREVLERLREMLPTYMIPEAIYSIPKLPLLTSGKLDRHRLSAMAELDAGQELISNEDAASTKPQDALEERICDIFGSILSRFAIAPTSHFFMLGGHSLLASRLKTAIELEFNVQFVLRDIFSGPTPRDVATKIRQLTPGPDLNKRQQAQGTNYPLSFAQGRLWFLAQLAGPEDFSYNSPLALNLSGDLKIDVLERTLHEIVSRHEVLRTIFLEVDGEPRAQILDTLPCLKIVEVGTDMVASELQTLVRNTAMQPFMLESQPPIRATLFKVSPCNSILLLAIHHIAWDGYSIDIFRDELVEIYGSFSHGKKHSLSSLNFQYKDFAAWQQSDDFERRVQPQIEYWKEHLRGTQPAQLPTDYSRPPRRSAQAGCYISHCKPGILERFRAVCQREHATLFMGLLTVFRAVHYQLSGQEDATFAFPTANRTRPETRKLLGFFVNTQAFRLKVRPGNTFLELLRQTRKQTLAAWANQDLPFDKIVSIMSPNRDPTRYPLTEIVCTYETVKTAPFSLGDIKASEFPVPWKSSRFDLEIYFKTTDEALRAEIIYSTDLYRESTIVGLAEKMQSMFENVARDPKIIVLSDQHHISTAPPISQELMNYLQDYIPAEFPLDRVLSNTVPFERRVHQFSLPNEVFGAFKVLSTHSQTSEPSLLFLAALRILQFRYSCNEDAAIGVSVADALTQCRNIIIVRLPISAKDALSSVLEGTPRAVQTASKYSEVPFLDAVAGLRSQLGTACDSGVRIVFAMDEGDGCQSNSALIENQPCFDMEWRFSSVAEGLKCDLFYNCAIFETDSIHAFASNFIDVVECLIFESDLEVEEIVFSHTLEQLRHAQIPIEQPSSPISHSSLAEAFDMVVAENKEQLAIIDGELHLTYREFDILSSILAKKIFDTIQEQDKYELISFCIPPSALAILAILSIIRCGAAYVPLDVRFPSERLETLLSDSGGRLLITTSDSPVFPTRPDVTRLDISDFLTDWKSCLGPMDAAALPSFPRQTDLAYIMYTSGSTGKPKGVPIKQSSVLSFVSNRDVLTFGPEDRVAQISNLAWDASVIDVWCTLLSGATLVCFGRYDVLDPVTLAYRFDLFNIHTCFMSPALFRQTLDVAPYLFGTIHTLILGGETVYYESFRKVREINPSLTIQNVYGPTETCVVATTFSLYPRDELPDSGPMPIGRPLKTAQVLVVDNRGRLVPPGVIGEILIGGEGVSSGYLNRAVETSHAFVELKFEGLDQRRSIFYHSGDAGKWRSDGLLQFVSRLTIGQVKIRGQRLELAEVEAAILHTGLANNAAVVYCKSEDSGDSFLVAYIVPSSDEMPPDNSTRKEMPGQKLNSKEGRPLQRQLLDCLEGSLPSFMIPQTIRSVTSLPLMSNGKLDRRRLEARVAADTENLRKIEHGSFEPPMDDIEQRLCELFEQILERAPIYRSSDFFVNGGHSLMAQRLTARLKHTFGVPFKVFDVFNLPTPKAMAEKVKAATILKISSDVAGHSAASPT